MANGTQPLPLTVASPKSASPRPEVVIGKNNVPFNGKPSMFGGYWIVVADRRSLDVVYNQYTESFDQAPDLGKYDTTDYMLVVASVGLGTGHVPQGPFYDFLWDNGAGKELKRVVQLYDTLSCGTYATVSYVLVGVLGPGKPDAPGLEASTLLTTLGVIMTAQLVPVVIDGQTYYFPTALSD